MFEQFLSQLAATSWVEWLGMATGMAAVWLSVKEKVAAWPFFFICYSSYVYVGHQFKLNAFMGMNIVFIAIAIYGWMKWSTGKGDGEHELPLSRTDPKHWPFIGLFLICGTILIGLLLNSLDGAKFPFIDAFATSCAFIAQWMLSRKQVETWLFWLVTDIVYLGIFASGRLWPSVLLFAVFIFLAIKGWREWNASLRQAP
jgi:nicotinamide mononucleotide transporter